MAGGNPAAMSAIMNSMPDSYSYGGHMGSGGGIAALLNAMRDRFSEEEYKSRLNMSEDLYRSKLRQWEEDKKHEFSATEAGKLGQVTEQLRSMITGKPNLGPEERALAETLQIVGGAGIESAIPVVQDLIKTLGSSYGKNMEQPQGMKYADALSLEGEDRRRFLYDQAMKQNANVVVNTGNSPEGIAWMSPEDKLKAGMNPTAPAYINKGEIKVPPSGAEHEAKSIQYINMMKNSLDELDKFSAANPDFNPSEFGDAILRDLSTDDSSIFGKAMGALQSPASKAYAGIAKQWVNANRAALSGAAVPEAEYARDLSIYFAKPGDSPQVAAMKDRLRRARLDDLTKIATLPPDERAKAWTTTRDRDAGMMGFENLSTNIGSGLPGIRNKLPTYADYVAAAKAAGKEIKSEEEFNARLQQRLGGK